MTVRLTNLHHRFGSQTVLDGVNLHLRDGDIYGFIGHNGAGKTTALRVALGLLRPESGSVEIDGHNPHAKPRIRALLGGLIERPGFFDHFSGRKNLRMLARLSSNPEHLANVDATLELVGLTAAANKGVGKYSQGMRQRLGLAQALLSKPRYLLLDEPTNGLDPQGIHDLRQILQRLTQETGVTILLSSHLLREVTDLCTRIGVLHQGKMLVEAPTADLLRSDAPRFHLDTDNNKAAIAHLENQPDLTLTAKPDGTLDLSVEPESAENLVSHLVSHGLKVRAFTPIETSLEQIYLDFASGNRQFTPSDQGEVSQAPAPAPAPEATPELRGAITKVSRYELTRMSRPFSILTILAPAIVAAIAVFNRHLGTQRDAGELAKGSLATASDVTAFEGLGRALQAGLPLLGLIAAAIASQSMAAEFSAGTLRNLLIRPLRRTEIVIGKLAALVSTTLLAYVLLLGSGAIAAGHYFTYGDLVEILGTNGATFPLLPAQEVWPELWPMLASPLLPLTTCVAIGFLCGTVTRTAAGALALTGGTLVSLELLRALFRKFDAETWLPGPYLPSPLANNSHVDFFVSFASGASNASNPFSTAALLVPLLWTASCITLVILTFRRRYVS
jgi:ABC-2 type transport system ATP-binding protein